MILNFTVFDVINLNAKKLDVKSNLVGYRVFINPGNIFGRTGHPESSNNRIESELFSPIAQSFPGEIS